MTYPRGLSEAEAAAWEKLAQTVDRLHPAAPEPPPKTTSAAKAKPPPKFVKPARKFPPQVQNSSIARPEQPAGRNPRGNLDGHWDRRLKAGDIAPDFSLDLHGHGLDAAYHRLMGGMMQARASGARVVLVVTGKSRPVDAADRGTSRGAIRAKILDWLAASDHGDAIAAIRKAHRRHGGEGALYIVLRRGG
jgi:DNA-nicking Smr family endonuclease